MERRIEADVEGWPTRPFEDGYDGLRQLASADFSGVVRAGGTWLFFVNGKIVGVFEGDLDDVENAQGTAHKAPHPSLPLLYAMQVTGGDTRAKYYTNDTSISQVHETLSSGAFTGYVELSENVLSGDYYQLYHGGASMSVAFVGNSGKMITGEDAFERADDEVGIYEVIDVDVEVTDVPEPEEPETSGAGATESAAADSSAEPEAAPAVDAADATGTAESSDATATADTAGTAGAATESASGTERPAGGEDESRAEASRGKETPSPDSDDRTPADEDQTATPAPPADGAEPEPSPSSSDDPDPGDESAAAEPMPEADTAGTDQGANEAETAPSTGTSEDTPSRRSRSGDRSKDTASVTAGDSPVGASNDDQPGSRHSAADGAGGSRTRTGHESAATAPTGNAPSPATDADEGAASAGGDDGGDRHRSESAWREATTVPSLDPDHSEEPEPPMATQSAGADARSGQQTGAQSDRRARDQSTQQSPASQRSRSRTQSAANKQSSSTQQRGSGQSQSANDQSGDTEHTLEQEVLEREDRIDRLQQRAENLEEERDEIAEERDRLVERVDSLTEENETLRGEIRSLEDEIEELEAAAERAEPSGTGGGPSATSGGAMTPRAALEGTDLFVRYDSKSAPTLEAAHDGSADAGEVNQNLRLDVHTQFEDEGTTVDGEPFETFLPETMAYRFVEWLVRTLPYEIRETGSASDLRDLYDALPEVDRVEFHGEVTRDAVEDEEGAPSETFDVVVRDKMGEALFVANMNDARDPATGRMIVDLQEAASRVKEHSMALSSAFFVTRSFFEPAALETASEATSGSLLSRDSRKSYVKLSRKQGYHLCLVEARGDDLHLNVPEL